MRRKQLHKVFYAFLLMIGASIVLSSCVNDDLSDCMVEKQIYFDFKVAVTGKKKDGIDPADLTKLNLYIFDEKGKFLREYTDESPKLSPEYFISIPQLKSGNYKFIAWGNLKDQYSLSDAELVPEKTSFDDLRVSLKCITNDTVKESLKPLFFATHAESSTIEVKENVSQRILLKIVDDTYKINLTVANVDTTQLLTNTYRMEIADNNGTYRFDNDFAACTNFAYVKPCDLNKEKYELESSLTVLRLAAGRMPVLRVINEHTNSVILKDNLIQLILAANAMGASLNFDVTHEFDIRFELDKTAPLTCIVYINGWKLIRQTAQM
jgi:hypothetical protein